MPNHSHPEKSILSMFAPRFRDRVDLPNRSASCLGSGLNQRDRATAGFGRGRSHGKPSKNFHCRGFQRSHDHSLIGAADRSFALRRNDFFAVITNHSRHGPLVVSQLRFSGPVPLNAVASMGQPTQLPLWASLLMLTSRASSLCCPYHQLHEPCSEHERFLRRA